MKKLSEPFWAALIDTQAYVDYTKTATQYESIEICKNRLEIQYCVCVSRFPDLNIVAWVDGAKTCRRKIDRAEPATNSCSWKMQHKTTAVMRFSLTAQQKLHLLLKNFFGSVGENQDECKCRLRQTYQCFIFLYLLTAPTITMSGTLPKDQMCISRQGHKRYNIMWLFCYGIASGAAPRLLWPRSGRKEKALSSCYAHRPLGTKYI